MFCRLLAIFKFREEMTETGQMRKNNNLFRSQKLARSLLNDGQRI
jgi:hypothetical protein